MKKVFKKSEKVLKKNAERKYYIYACLMQHAGGERMRKKKAAVGAIVVSAVVLAVLFSAALLPVQAPGGVADDGSPKLAKAGETTQEAVGAAGGYRSAAFGIFYGYGPWIKLSSTYKSILSLDLKLPRECYVYVDCDGYAYLDNSEIEVAIGIDRPVEDSSTRRFYGFRNYEDRKLEDGYTGIHTSRLYKLSEGNHTIYFLARVDEGTTAKVNYMSISALAFTDGNLVGPTPTPPPTLTPTMEVQPEIAPDGSSE